ncbi:MAG: hypothetical protein J6A16_08970 [Oscillospiraceae bacterium]|nr:hypothetical protein [Oscillospiraceae bacterium]
MQFLTTVCMAAIASALFRILVPESKNTKQISLLIACIFLLAVIKAFTGAELKIEPPSVTLTDGEDYLRLSGQVDRELQKRICGELSDKLYALLEEQDIFPEQIHVNVNISGTYSISITQVKLVLSKEQQDRAEDAVRTAESVLSEDIELKVVIKE